MKKLKLYYSVSNGGDGSAYPHFSLSEELVELDQEIQSELTEEGWGESCTGFIELEAESDIKIISPDIKYMITKESLLERIEYYLDGGYRKSQSIKESAKELLEKLNSINS